MSDGTAQGMGEERLAEIKAAAGRERWATYCGHIGPRAMVTELLDEVERLNTVLDANRVVRNAAESSSRTYKAVTERLKAERTQLRAENAELRARLDAIGPLADEYGMRITYVSTRTEEGAIADTLNGALEALATFDAKGRDDVLSRKLRVRKVGAWQDVEEGDDRG